GAFSQCPPGSGRAIRVAGWRAGRPACAPIRRQTKLCQAARARPPKSPGGFSASGRRAALCYAYCVNDNAICVTHQAFHLAPECRGRPGRPARSSKACASTSHQESLSPPSEEAPGEGARPAAAEVRQSVEGEGDVHQCMNGRRIALKLAAQTHLDGAI